MEYRIRYNMDRYMGHVIDDTEERYARSKRYFEDNSINKFIIKDWKTEAGSKYHPLLKDSPLLITDMWRKEFMKIDDDIQSLFKGEYYGDYYKDREHMRSFSFPEGDLGQKILSIIGKDLNIDYEFRQIAILENQIGVMDRPAENWHTDQQMRETVRIIIYLSDVEDEADGPFEYIARPEERHINLDTLHDLDLNAEAGMNIYNYVDSLPKEKKAKMYGKKYTAVIFDPVCIHRGSNPTRRPRRIMLVDIKRRNSISIFKK
jgi:hypothetical protein